jgi:hypothetical protein
LFPWKPLGRFQNTSKQHHPSPKMFPRCWGNLALFWLWWGENEAQTKLSRRMRVHRWCCPSPTAFCHPLSCYCLCRTGAHGLPLILSF